MNIKFGLFSDLHAPLPGVEERGYSSRSLSDMRQGLQRFVAAGADFAVCLGDMTQPAGSVAEQYRQISDIVNEWNSYEIPVHAVFGNHEFQQLSWQQVFEIWNVDRGYFSFDLEDIRFLILDTNIRPDGAHFSEDDFDWRYGIIDQEQIRWLKEQLSDRKRTFVFTHANLYFDPADEHVMFYQIQNHQEIINILADAGGVDTVFQGHHHTYWTGTKQGIRFVNISSPEQSPAYTDNDFPIIEITDDAVFYNGSAMV